MVRIAESLLFVAMGVAIVGLFMFFPSLKTTGSVIADYGDTVAVGDALSYNININVPEGGGDASIPILVSLSKNGKIIDSKIITLGDFVKLSDGNVALNNGQFVSSGNYVADVSNIIRYNFDRKGEYELYYAIFKLDIVRAIKIIVE